MRYTWPQIRSFKNFASELVRIRSFCKITNRPKASISGTSWNLDYKDYKWNVICFYIISLWLYNFQNGIECNSFWIVIYFIRLYCVLYIWTSFSYRAISYNSKDDRAPFSFLRISKKQWHVGAHIECVVLRRLQIFMQSMF